jgi:sugar/nucleoside kinase (ribokinase family)
MPDAAYDVVGIGNAIVDVLAHADDAFLQQRKLVKGSMRLIDALEAEWLYGEMPPGVECSGGSVANTMAGIASLGGRACFLGRVRNDQLGAIFAHDIRAVGVRYATPPAADGPSTARCLILVTPDAQRTMNTYLGASVDFGPEDLDAEAIRSAQITYLEGYLWDPPRAKAAFLEAVRIAHAAGRKVALSLSDAFCVERHRAEFRELVAHHVDVLFANEREVMALYEAPTFEAAAHAVRGLCEIAALTRSEHGSVVLSAETTVTAPAEPAAKVVDTTGAGDLYAAGFLHGLTHGRSPRECARLGGLAAAEVIGHMGARPEIPLRDLVARL